MQTITLNRPETLNAFTPEMHKELRAALEQARDDAAMRAVLLTGAGRGFCSGQDLSQRRVEPRRGADRSVGVPRLALQPAGAPLARAAQAHRLRGQRRRRGRRREHRARLRSGARRALGQLRAVVRAPRPGARFGRHLLPAAPGRHARAPWAWPCSPSRSRPRTRSAGGLIWKVVRRRAAHERGARARAQARCRADQGLWTDEESAERVRAATRSMRSSTWSATCSARRASRRTTARAWRLHAEAQTGVQRQMKTFPLER